MLGSMAAVYESVARWRGINAISRRLAINAMWKQLMLYVLKKRVVKSRLLAINAQWKQ
jgi:hypothetical protein